MLTHKCTVDKLSCEISTIVQGELQYTVITRQQHSWSSTNKRTRRWLVFTKHHRHAPVPMFIGEYGTFDEWKFKLQAYMGLYNQLPQLLENAENSTTIKESDLAAATATEETNKWIQLSTDLRYILNICTGATLCKQHQTHNGFEIYRQLCLLGSQFR